MSSYAIDPITGVQSRTPAMSVVTATVDHPKGKGKGKATATPVVPTAPATSAIDYSKKPDSEEAGNRFLCYRGDRYLACINCVKADIPCINVLNAV
jgi:hypothetical protein